MPPYTDIRSVQTLVDGDRLQIRYGAQDVSEHDGGAYTGEISAAMLAKLGCSYVVVGHSERREYHGESDELVNTKAHKALGGGHDADRLRRRGARGPAGRRARRALHVPGRGVARRASPPSRSPGWSIAYEPVWAIGTGEVATPADAQEVCQAIRGQVREAYGDEAADGVRILYGGSVKAANVAGIMAEEDVDGCLVGGASLQADEFGGICRYYDMPVL